MGRSRRTFKDKPKSGRVKRRQSKHARSKAKRYMKRRRVTNLRKRRSRRRSRNIAGGSAADPPPRGEVASDPRKENYEAKKRLLRFAAMVQKDEVLEANKKKEQNKKKIEAGKQEIAKRAKELEKVKMPRRNPTPS